MTGFLEKLRTLLFEPDSSRGGLPSGRRDSGELHVAAAAMLIDAAMSDGHVDEVERERIAVLIERHFGIPKSDVHSVMEEGERRAERAVDIFSFLRVLGEHFEEEERVALIEMLWETAYADGVIHDHEASLIRRVTGLLGITDVAAGEARKRVVSRLGVEW